MDVFPRVKCDWCERPDIAAMPIAREAGWGRLWRHDRPETRRIPSGLLVSCPGSLCRVKIPAQPAQLALDFEGASAPYVIYDEIAGFSNEDAISDSHSQ